MKVLWFEVTTPGRYKESSVIGGWQDSLECIVRLCPEIELSIAFETTKESENKFIDGVNYYPLYVEEDFFQRWNNRWTCKQHTERLIELALNLIERVSPDVIHIFGSEWLWGLIAKKTKIPVVIHIQGALIPYYNALYPPSYNKWNKYHQLLTNPKQLINTILDDHRFYTSYEMEKSVWTCVENYMGRTDWDKAFLNTQNAKAKYFHVEEALRSQFFENGFRWIQNKDSKIHLMSTGCGTFWKGPDMLLKTAHVLKKMGIDFEWKVAGGISDTMITLVERHENLSFSENNVTFIGYTEPDDLAKLLCSSSMYVHTAYIENSPNSICEAQIMGVPIVSTNVGGISSLIGNEGVLIPANDPWQMAHAIIKLFNDKERMRKYSLTGREKALVRHNPNNIVKQLLNCYSSILTNART